MLLPRVAGRVSGVVSRVRARGAARQLSCRVGDRDLHAGAFGIPVAAQHAGPSRWRREAPCERRAQAREIPARAVARRGSPELRLDLKAGGSGPWAPGPAARGIWVVPACAAPAGPSPGGLAWSLRRGPPPAVPAAAVPGFSAMAAPGGLPLKSRDRRRRMPVGTWSKLQPHARNQAALRLTMFGLFAEPSSPHARDRQREQPTWRHGQVRVGLWPFSVTVDLGKD
jgi:hypothetical protein